MVHVEGVEGVEDAVAVVAGVANVAVVEDCTDPSLVVDGIRYRQRG